MVDIRVRTPEGTVLPSSGVHISPQRKRGDPLNYKPGNPFNKAGQPTAIPEDFFRKLLQNSVQPDGAIQSAPFGPNGGNNGGGGRGGSPAGPDPEQVRKWAAELYGFNSAPYDQMRGDVVNQVAQANAYNPDFAAMQNRYNQGLATSEQQRSQAVQARLQQMVGVGQQLAGQQGQAMQGALRDLTAQGINPNQYIQQANQIGGDRTQALSNQQEYVGQLELANTNAMKDARDTGGLIRQGAESTLANNRGVLLNDLARSKSQIGLQEAQARQANDQARREFLIKYGVT